MQALAIPWMCRGCVPTYIQLLVIHGPFSTRPRLCPSPFGCCLLLEQLLLLQVLSTLLL